MQQQARFTFHPPEDNKQEFSSKSLALYTIPASNKEKIQLELRRCGINWATLFPDIDHIAKEICTAWKINN